MIAGSCPPYTALSYAWGTPRSLDPIIIDGRECSISPTVAEALQRLQDDKKERWVWVDQICINQTDDAEGSDQVEQMHQVYSEAGHVVAWLGAAADDSDSLLDLLKQLAMLLVEGTTDSLLQSIAIGKEESPCLELSINFVKGITGNGCGSCRNSPLRRMSP